MAVPGAARAGEETYGLVVWLMGLGFLAWLAGLTGLVKAFAHRRWALRVLVGCPPSVPGGWPGSAAGRGAQVPFTG